MDNLWITLGVDNLWITFFSKDGASEFDGNSASSGWHNRCMKSDTYTDRIHETADLVAWVMDLMKTSIFEPTEMHEWMQAVKKACDGMVAARIEQWHHRGY